MSSRDRSNSRRRSRSRSASSTTDAGSRRAPARSSRPPRAALDGVPGDQDAEDLSRPPPGEAGALLDVGPAHRPVGVQEELHHRGQVVLADAAAGLQVAAQGEVLQPEEQLGPARLPVTRCAARLLEVLVDAGRRAGVQDGANVGTVDAHAEGVRRDDRLRPPLQERIGRLTPLPGGQARVVDLGRTACVRERRSQLPASPAGRGVDDDRPVDADGGLDQCLVALGVAREQPGAQPDLGTVRVADDDGGVAHREPLADVAADPGAAVAVSASTRGWCRRSTTEPMSR